MSYWFCLKMKTMPKKQKKNKVGDVKKQEKEVVKAQTKTEIQNLYQEEEVKRPAVDALKKMEEGEVESGKVNLKKQVVEYVVKPPVGKVLKKQIWI